jgi:invasion protein IalB
MNALFMRSAIFPIALIAGQLARAEEFLSPKPLAPQAKPAAAPKPAVKSVTKPQAGPGQQMTTANSAALELLEEVGDWKLQCGSTPARNCQMSQRRVNPESNQLLIWMELTRTNTPKEMNQLTVMLPLGLRVTTPLAVTVDGQPFAAFNIVTCVPAGCIYAHEMGSPEVQALLQAQRINMEVSDLRGQRFALTVSMRGFDNAFLKTALYLRKP